MPNRKTDGILSSKHSPKKRGRKFRVLRDTDYLLGTTTMMSDDNDDVVTRITHNVAVISDIATSLLQQLTRTRSLEFVNIRKINGRVNELSDLHTVS